VDTSTNLFRPMDIAESYANPGKAAEKLGWQARYNLDDVVRFMADEKIFV